MILVRNNHPFRKIANTFYILSQELIKQSLAGLKKCKISAAYGCQLY